MKGLIVMYNKDKGYGFVKGEDNQEYHFKDRAIAFGEMPEKGRHCEFTPSVSTQTTSNKKSKKPQIESLKVLATQVNSAPVPPPISHTRNTLRPVQPRSAYRDDRVTCPHCGKKIVPRVIYWKGMVDRSICPFCTKTIDVSDEPIQAFLSIIKIIVGLILIVFILMGLGYVKSLF